MKKLLLVCLLLPQLSFASIDFDLAEEYCIKKCELMPESFETTKLMCENICLGEIYSPEGEKNLAAHGAKLIGTYIGVKIIDTVVGKRVERAVERAEKHIKEHIERNRRNPKPSLREKWTSFNSIL